MMAAVGLTRQLAERASHTAPESCTTMTTFDVGTAFLNGEMRDKHAYVRYVDSAGRSRVSTLEKPLYGLRVAPLRWHEKFSADVAAFGLRPFRLNPCVFTNEDHTIRLGLRDPRLELERARASSARAFARSRAGSRAATGPAWTRARAWA
jgi:hypothetical protein